MSQPNMNNNNHDHKDTKIFVGGLAWRTTTDDLRRFFQQFGEVLDANVVSENFPGGRSKGYGFVTFRDAETATRACEPPYPIIDGRQTNINLAYIGAKNNTNQSNLNGFLHQAGPWQQYQNGLSASHQYQFANPHFPQLYWDPYYGQYCYTYNVPCNPYSPTMISDHYVSTTNGMQQNWHQRNSRRPIRISKPPREPRIDDITSTNQEAISTGDVVRKDNNEEADTEPYSTDQQKDQEGEISGQDNGIKQDVKDREVEIMSGQDDDTKQDVNVTKQLSNGTEVTLQSEIVHEEEAKNTPQENGVEHEEDGEGTSQGSWI